MKGTLIGRNKTLLVEFVTSPLTLINPLDTMSQYIGFALLRHIVEDCRFLMTSKKKNHVKKVNEETEVYLQHFFYKIMSNAVIVLEQNLQINLCFALIIFKIQMPLCSFCTITINWYIWVLLYNILSTDDVVLQQQ